MCGLKLTMILCLISYIFTAPADGSQRTCTIISTSLPTVTTPSGVIANGTQNVILYCICMDDNVAVGPTEWLFNGIKVTLTTASGNNPYARNNVPGPLIIPSFVTGNDGTYQCGSGDSSQEDTITLTLLGMYSLLQQVIL